MEQELDASKQDDILDDLSSLNIRSFSRQDRPGSDRDIFEDFDHINEDFFRDDLNHTVQAIK